MRMPNIMKLTKPQKNTLLGGIVASLAYNAEQAASEIMVPYPPELSERMTPGIPRNGKLLALGAPLAGSWVVAKYKKGATVQDMKMGVTLYDVPKLVHQFINEACYQAGVDSVSGTGLRTAAGLPIQVRPRTASTVNTGIKYKATGTPAATASVGRYAPA